MQTVRNDSIYTKQKFFLVIIATIKKFFCVIVTNYFPFTSRDVKRLKGLEQNSSFIWEGT